MEQALEHYWLGHEAELRTKLQRTKQAHEADGPSACCTTDAGRASSKVMKALPEHVVPYRRTSVFTEITVPKGLLESHRTKPGTWGKIVVLEGTLEYRIMEPGLETHCLGPDLQGIVEPTIAHEVRPQGRVRFYVQFYRAASS